MSRTDEQQRSIAARIERLRKRAQQMAQDDPRAIVVAGVILGILDLVEDRLDDPN